MIELLKDFRRMKYILRFDREELLRASTSQDEYNNFICRISQTIYNEIKENT